MDSEILTNVYKTIQDLWDPIYYTGLCLGFCLIILGLFSLTPLSKQQGRSGIGMLIGGFLLINTKAALSIVSFTILGKSGDFSFAASVSSGPGEAYMMVAISAIKCIGLYGFVRGGYLLSKSGEHGGGFWAALVHIVGGSLALNLEFFAKLIGDTLGGSFGKFINSLFN